MIGLCELGVWIPLGSAPPPASPGVLLSRGISVPAFPLESPASPPSPGFAHPSQTLAGIVAAGLGILKM